MDTSYVEGSLWKQKNSLTGATWKKHWVQANESTVQQWHGKVRPPPSEKAKYCFQLSDCTVEDFHARKFCFKIVELSTKLTLILAADDFDVYEKWLKVLFTHKKKAVEAAVLDFPVEETASSIHDTINHPNYEASESSDHEEEFLPSEDDEVSEDPVLTYFKRHNRVVVGAACLMKDVFYIVLYVLFFPL
jgi:hypothetical protein